MNILIIEPNGSQKFNSLKEKAIRKGWTLKRLKEEVELTPLILMKFDMVIFGHIMKKHVNACLLYNYMCRVFHPYTFNAEFWGKQVKLVYYPEDNDADYLAPAYFIKYPLGGSKFELEETKPEYYRCSQEDIEMYSPYLKIYDMEYPSNHIEWAQTITQIEYYLKNGLEPLVDSETLESTIEYYGLDEYLTSTALDSRNFFNKPRHRLIEEDFEDNS